VLFNSTEFLLFYSATFLLYYALAPFGAWRLQKLLLLVASLLFYVSWSVPFVLLLLGMVTICFVTGLAVAAGSSEVARRRRLAVGVGASLAILAYFKYLGFLVENLVYVGVLDRRLSVLLPLGISF